VIYTYAISVYHHWYCEFEFRSGWGVQHYVIKFVTWYVAMRIFVINPIPTLFPFGRNNSEWLLFNANSTMSDCCLMPTQQYLCNQCLSPLILWVRISIRARCTALCDKVCDLRHDIAKILLKVAFNTIKQTNKKTYCWESVITCIKHAMKSIWYANLHLWPFVDYN
jgi:hypothetical protein